MKAKGEFTRVPLGGGAEMLWCQSVAWPDNIYLKLRESPDGEEGGWYMSSEVLLEMAHECARLAKIARKLEKGERV